VKSVSISPLSAIVLAIVVAGCGKPEYEIAEVSGVLFINGRPGNKVRIEFVPDAGVKGPRSAGETDEQGMFVLRAMERDGSAPFGAVVGKHKVTLTDMRLAESATGQGVPIRFGSEYGVASSTPLMQEVRPAKQTIELKIP